MQSARARDGNICRGLSILWTLGWAFIKSHWGGCYPPYFTHMWVVSICQELPGWHFTCIIVFNLLTSLFSYFLFYRWKSWDPEEEPAQHPKVCPQLDSHPKTCMFPVCHMIWDCPHHHHLGGENAASEVLPTGHGSGSAQGIPAFGRLSHILPHFAWWVFISGYFGQTWYDSVKARSYPQGPLLNCPSVILRLLPESTHPQIFKLSRPVFFSNQTHFLQAQGPWYQIIRLSLLILHLHLKYTECCAKFYRFIL